MNELYYFDMDGVLADFDEGAMRLFGFDASQSNVATELLQGDARAQKEAFWAKVRQHPEFWTHLKPIHAGIRLFKTKQNTKILTAAPSSFGYNSPDFNEVAKRKLAWCMQHLNLDPSNFICTTSLKKTEHLVPNAKCILIDDRKDNIERWQKAGGTGIHFCPKNAGMDI